MCKIRGKTLIMAQLNLFSYHPSATPLHRLDPRAKFIMVCLLSISMVHSHLLGSAIYLGSLLAAFKVSGIFFFRAVRQLKGFLILLLMIILVQAVSIQGDPFIRIWGISVTSQGLFSGFQTAFKFFLIMMTGLLFATTTRLNAVKNTAQWFLRPVPWLPEQRISVMIGLALGFIPLILKHAGQLSDAHKARLGNNNKHPVSHTIQMVLPLLKKTFRSADDIASAMSSRCYSEDRTGPVFQPSGKEPVFLCVTLALALLLFLF